MKHNHRSVYKTTVKAPVQKVWEALTNPAIVREYFFGSNLVTDWKVGSPIYFQGEWEEKPYKDKGIVQDYKPLKSLSYTYLSNWSGLPDLPENYLDVTYELKPNADGTELVITQSNYDEDKVKHSEENWAAVMEGMKKIIE